MRHPLRVITDLLNIAFRQDCIQTAANSLGNLGTIYRDMGDTEKSIKYYHKSIEQAKQEEDMYDLIVGLSWI